MKFKIRTPIWKYQAVGLDQNKLNEINIVEILYTNKSGERLWPSAYKVTKTEALKYPTMEIKGHTLRIVPISAMEGAK